MLVPTAELPILPNNRDVASRSPLYSETTASRSVDDASSKSTFSPTPGGVATPLKREKANPVA